MPRKNIKGKQVRLTKRWREIADAYVLDPRRNKTAAYASVMTNCTRESARVASCIMFKTPVVHEYVTKRLAQLEEISEKKFQVSAERLLLILSQMVVFDPRDCLDSDGELLPIKEWPDDAVMALQGLESASGATSKARFLSRYDGIEKMMRYLGMYEAENKQLGDALGRLLQNIGNKGPQDLA